MKNSFRLITASIVLGFGLLSVSTAQAAAIPYPDSGATNQNSYTFTATTTGQIGAFFYESSAAYTNTLSLLVNGVVTPESSMGVLNNQTSDPGYFVNLGNVHAGDVLTFQLNVLDTGDTWHSDTALNADGINHIYSAAFSGDAALGIPTGTYVGFEDLYGGGDLDYNDEGFVFTNISSYESISPVPEPETYLMLLMGLGLLAFTAHRRKAA